MELGISPFWTALATLCVAATLFGAGYTAGLGSAAETLEAAPVQTALPDWFLPIWDAYDRNPAITPEFDFAALYSGKLDGAQPPPR